MENRKNADQDLQALSNDKYTTKKSMRGTIFKLAWPVIAEQSLATITQIVDMMMVGRLGPAAITAIGLSMQPLMLAQALGAAVSVGTTALVARFTGAGEDRKASRILQQSLLSSVFISFIILFFYYVFSENIIVIMGAEVDVIPLGTKYLQLLIPGLFFMYITFMISAALRGVGDTKTPMKINLLINVLNIVGNYMLIFGNLGAPELGINGAAIATTISRIIGGIILLIYMFFDKLSIKVVKKNFFVLDINLIKRILNIGLPATLEQLVMRLAQIFFIRIVSGLGTIAFAAHQIANNAESISYMPGFGVAVAATTLVGQNLGADKPEMAEKSVYESWKIGALLMGFMAILFLLIPEYLIKLYTDDQEIIKLASRNLRVVAFSQIPMGSQFIFAGALRGAGDTRSVFYSTAISSWVGRLTMTYLFINVFHWGLVGAWVAMVIDWTMRGSYVFYRFRQGHWKTLKI